MGACTFTRASGSFADRAEGVLGAKRVVRGTLTFSATYATGGDTIPLASVGLREVTEVLVDPQLSASSNDSGLSVVRGGTTVAPTLRAFDAQATEVPNATNLSARTAIPVWLIGYA